MSRIIWTREERDLESKERGLWLIETSYCYSASVAVMGGRIE